MRTLVVDALRAAGPRTAMGRYIERMASWWSRSPCPFDRIVMVCPEPALIGRLGTATPVEVRAIAAGWPRLAWEQVALPAWARNASLLYCPSYTAPLGFPGPLVVANHGIYEAVPAEFSRWARLRTTPLHRLSARRARRVIVNSQQTATDVSRFFGVRPSKIDVVYPAAAEVFFAAHDQADCDREVELAFGARVPYIIFVGKLARRRNVPNLIAAFAQVIRHEHLRHHLLIVGPDTSGVSVPGLAEANGVGDRVRWRGHLEQEPLARLYAGADVFALPTTYEGISWTMFEAMASGTAVLTVDHPTLAEGAGDTAYTVTSPSVADIAAGLTALLTNERLRSDHATLGRERAQRFSWQHAADETMKILDQVGRPADLRERR